MLSRKQCKPLICCMEQQQMAAKEEHNRICDALRVPDKTCLVWHGFCSRQQVRTRSPNSH